jgi:hypothetical protein
MKLNSFAAILSAAIIAVLLSVQTGQAAAKPTLIEQRMLTQEGLAIALASTVLQSQLNILITSIADSTGCDVLPGNSGSDKLISYKLVNKNEVKATVGVYFDEKCKKPYIMAQTQTTTNKKALSYNVIETANYTGPTGFKLGSLTVNESAFLNKKETSVTDVTGLGTFVPANGAVHVDLGLECAFSDLSKKSPPPFPCSGGIAQNFTKLSEALASVTPLTLTLTPNGKNFSVSFAGSKSDMVTGALHALSITAPTDSSLGIAGKQEKYGSAVTKGSAAKFSLFPPKPTSWSVIDKANDTMFAIAVASDATRDSRGKVTKISTGKTLASFAVDQSGTGSITYSDGSSATITSWLLSD